MNNEDDIRYNKRGNQLDEDGRVIRTNKTQVKRDVAALADTIKTLVAMSDSELKKIPLDDDQLAAIKAAQTMKMGALKRQLQFINKIMRQGDIEHISEAVTEIVQARQGANRAFKQLEKWRERLLNSDDKNAFTEFCEQYPNADIQRLRQLIRNAEKERSQQKPPKYFRELFQEIKAAASNSGI